MRKPSLFAFSAVLCALIASCSHTNEETLAANALQQEIADQSQNNVKLFSFVKTDGETANVSGVEARRIEFRAVVEFRRRGTWLPGGSPNIVAYRFSTNYDDALPTAMSKLAASDGARRIHLGDQATITGTITGTKKDSGWHYETTASSFEPQGEVLVDPSGKLVVH